VLPSGKVGFLVGDLAFAYSRHVASLEPERNQCPFFFGPLVGKDLLVQTRNLGLLCHAECGNIGWAFEKSTCWCARVWPLVDPLDGPLVGRK
jgi:hypothetical protein